MVFDEPLRVYMAGAHGSSFCKGTNTYNALDETEKWMRDSVSWHLESFHYIRKGRAVEHIRRNNTRIFLDSGAFSAWRVGASIEMNEYCDFVNSHQDIILHDGGHKMIAPLDIIGDGEGSFVSYLKMREQGVDPLPCFHFGDRWELLDEYMKYSDYIAIGGMVGTSPKVLRVFLDELFERIADYDGSPKIKTHGFGLTSLPLMVRYPFYSVDSSVWVMWASNGLILLPDSAKQINISSQSSSRKQSDQHIDTVSPPLRSAIENEITKFYVDPQRLRDIYQSRWAWNIWCFPYFAGIQPRAQFFKQEQLGFFNSDATPSFALEGMLE